MVKYEEFARRNDLYRGNFCACAFQQPTAPKSRESIHKSRTKVKRNADNDKRIPSIAQSNQATEKDASSIEERSQDREVKVTALPPEITTKSIKGVFDRTILFCTVVLTVVGVVGTIVALRTLSAIKRQGDLMDAHRVHLEQLASSAGDNAKAAQENASATKASADTLIASQRAFVYFPAELEVVKVNDTNGTTIRYDLFIPIENSGNTQTVDMVIHTNLYVHPSSAPLPAGFDYPDYGSTSRIPVVLGPRARLISVPLSVKPDEMLALWQQRKRIYFYGWANYRDVFPGTQPHRTEFCYELVRFEVSGDRIFRLLRIHPEHNSAT